MYPAGVPVKPTSLIRKVVPVFGKLHRNVSTCQETVSLGTDKFVVSKQGFGCMGFDAFYFTAQKTSESDAINLVKKAFSLGVTHFDTAQFYGNKGENETMIGKAISEFARDKVQVVTKGGMGKNFAPDGNPKLLRASIEQSLKRLGTDYLDLFNLARIDTKTPIEDTVGELKLMVQEGKLRHIGLSEASAKTIEKANAVHPIAAVQIEWSLFAREFEKEVIPKCRDLGVGIVAYSPLGKGVLAGLFKSNSEIPKGDFRTMVPRLSGKHFDENFAKVQQLIPIAEAKGCTMGQLALAWVHHQGMDVCPIPGTTSEKHLIENIEALSVELTPEEVEKLSSLFPIGSIKGGRYPPGAPTFESN